MQFFTFITSALVAVAAASPLRAVENNDALALARRQAEETQDSLAKLQAVGPQLTELLEVLAAKQNPSIASAGNPDFSVQAADVKVQNVIQDIVNGLGGVDGIKNIVKSVVGLIPGASNFQGIVDSALNIILPLITGGAKGNGSGAGAGAAPAAPAAPAKNSTAKAFDIATVSDE